MAREAPAVALWHTYWHRSLYADQMRVGGTRDLDGASRCYRTHTEGSQSRYASPITAVLYSVLLRSAAPPAYTGYRSVLLYYRYSTA